MRLIMVDKTNEIDCGLKEIKMKHDQWSVDWRKWYETWTMNCGLKEKRWNMNNEVDDITSHSLSWTILQAGQK